MPTMLEGAPGRVAVLDDPNLQGVLPLVRVNGGVDANNEADVAMSFQNRKSLITRIVIAQETNHQFMHMLGGDIYIYVFGDRIGQMTISGLSVSQDCDNTGGKHGFEKMLEWYTANKLSKRRKPVTVLIGETPISGFLAGMTGGVFDHKLLLMQFDLTLMVLPTKD